MDTLKSLYDRAGVALLIFALLALLGYGYASDRSESIKYRCEALRAENPPRPCTKS